MATDIQFVQKGPIEGKKIRTEMTTRILALIQGLNDVICNFTGPIQNQAPPVHVMKRLVQRLNDCRKRLCLMHMSHFLREGMLQQEQAGEGTAGQNMLTGLEMTGNSLACSMYKQLGRGRNHFSLS